MRDFRVCFKVYLCLTNSLFECIFRGMHFKVYLYTYILKAKSHYAKSSISCLHSHAPSVSIKKCCVYLCSFLQVLCNLLFHLKVLQRLQERIRRYLVVDITSDLNLQIVNFLGILINFLNAIFFKKIYILKMYLRLVKFFTCISKCT